MNDTARVQNVETNRDIIKSLLHETRVMIMQLHQIDDQMDVFDNKSNVHRNDREYLQNLNIIIKEFVDVDEYNMICSKCDFVCQEQCTSHAKEYEIFTISDGRCTKCPGRCMLTEHYIAQKLIKQLTRKTDQVIMDVRDKKGIPGKENTKLQTIPETKKFISIQLQKEYKQIEELCHRLKSSCIEFDIADELYTFIMELKNNYDTLNSKFVQLEAEHLITCLERLSDDLQQTLPSTPLSAYFNYSPVENRNTNRQFPRFSTSSDKEKPEKSVESSSESCSTYVEYSTNRLLQTYSDLMNMGNHERCIAIQDEFHRRCHGQSIGYLTEDSLLSFCKLYNRCQNEKPDSLSKKQIALQKAVLDITDENVLNIANVPNEHLLELAAIVLSLKNVSFA